MISRRRWLARASRQGALAPLLGPRLRLRLQRYQVALGGPAMRIAVISDLHYGFGRSTEAFADQLRRRVLALGADAVFFLGDIAGGYPWQQNWARVQAGARALRGYGAPLGCFAVLGNHDWEDDPEARARRAGPSQSAELLRAAGWQVLENAAQPFHGYWLAGLGSQMAFHAGRFPRRFQGVDDLGQTLASVPPEAPVILMAHEPDIFPDLPDRALLTLSGHTHAGQIRPFGRAMVVPSRHGTRYAHGHYADGRRQLIVSAGLGCSAVPLRYGAVPEIVLLELS